MPFTPTPVGDVTPNAGRTTWNANDAGIADVANDAEATADQTAANLVTHKTSADHDGRYYTESEIDGQRSAHNASADHDGRYYTESESDGRYVRLDTDQFIDGIKQFTAGLNAASANPSVRLYDVDGTTLRGLITASAYSSRRYLSLLLQGVSGVVEVMTIVSDDVSDPNQKGWVDFDRDIYMKQNKVATENYVQDRVRSSNAFMTGQTASLNNGNSGYTQAAGTTQLFALPTSARIKQVIVNSMMESTPVQNSVVCNVAAPNGLVKIHIAQGQFGCTLTLQSEGGTTLFQQVFTMSDSSISSATHYVTLLASV